MRDVKWPELTAVVEFMYKGEINVRQEQIAPLLRVAEMLKIRGLADVKSDLDLNSESEKSTSTPSLDDATDVTPTIATKTNSTNGKSHFALFMFLCFSFFMGERPYVFLYFITMKSLG